MTKTVEFRPTIKAVKMNKGSKQEVVLSIENGSLDGKFESLSQLIGESVNVVIQPSIISYRIPYDRETGESQLKYVVDKNGMVVEVKEEQLSLEEFGSNTAYRNYIVEINDIDNYIKSAHSLQLPSHIELNPREILFQLEDGDTYEEIAEELEVKESSVVATLEKARMHFAPYAAAWVESKKKEEEE